MTQTHWELRGLPTSHRRSGTPLLVITSCLFVAVDLSTTFQLVSTESGASSFATLGLITLALSGFASLLLCGVLVRRHHPSELGFATPHPLDKQVSALSTPHRSSHHPFPARRLPDLRAERKRVTVMFADFCGSTSMAQTMDPEEVRDLISSCFDRMVPIVTEYGGTVNTFLGDGILTLFGAPATHEDDPERSLRAALRMQEVLAAFGAEQGISLQMHFGINTGLVVAGGVGSSGLHDYGVMGDAVNLAARLEAASRSGEIFVGPETYRLTSHLFDFQPVGSLRIKGRNEPVPAFKLLGSKARPAARRLEARTVSSPLVGRSRELALAMQRIERVKSGQGGVLSIVGEAGLGKSRLIAELRQLAERMGLCWLEGGGLSIGQHISYGPFIEIIQTYSGIVVGDREDERWKKLEKRVNELLPGEARDLLPYLAALLNVDTPGEQADRFRYLDGEAIGRQVFRTARKFFAALAVESPFALVFDDVRWLDHSSLQLLEHLLPLCRETSFLIILACRPGQDGPTEWLRQAVEEQCKDQHTVIRLSPLSPSDTVQLVRNLIRADELPSELHDIVSLKAEGNPLFVEEVVRTLVDSGGLTREEPTGRWKTTERVEQIPIPDTLSGIIAARIDRLSDGAKEVLKLASVIGRSFLYRVLEGITEPDQTPAEGLLELLALGLVSERRGYPEPEYLFKQVLVQEATYESILLRRRQELHRRVAEYIESTFADRLDEFYGLVAYHYTKAEIWTKSQEYLLKAADQSARIAADTEALARYQQALAAYGRAFGNKWDPVERAVLESNIGRALFQRGEHSHGRRHLERALTVLGRPYPTSRWGVRLALVREIARQAVHRMVPVRSVKPASLHVDRVSAELSHQYETLKWMDFFLGGERYMLSTLLLLNQAERCGNAVGIVRASSGLGIGLDALGLKRLGEFYCRRATTLADEIGEPMSIGEAYTLLGIHEEYSMGKVDAAREHFRRGAGGYWESGSIKGWAAATTLAGRTMARLGDYPGALALFRHVSQVAEDAAEHQAQGWGLSFEGEMLEATGAFQDASARLLSAIELFRDVPDHMSSALARGLLGRCYMRWGRLSEAQQLLEQTRRLVVERGLRGFMSSPVWMSIAEVDLAIAEQTNGRARKACLARAQRSAEAVLKQGQVDLLVLPPGFRIRGSIDYLLGKADGARKWWQRSLQDAEARGMRYELGMTHLEIGRRTSDGSHLRLAESLLEEIGAQFDLTQAREQLRVSGSYEWHP